MTFHFILKDGGIAKDTMYPPICINPMLPILSGRSPQKRDHAASVPSPLFHGIDALPPDGVTRREM